MHRFYGNLRRIRILWSTIHLPMQEPILETCDCSSAFSFASPKENAGSSEPASPERVPANRGGSYPLSPPLPLQIANAALVCNLRPGGISISLRTSLNRPRNPLRFSWIFPAEFVTAQNYAHPKAPLKGELSAKLTERSQQAATKSKSLSADPYALPNLIVGVDAGHSRSRRRSVTDVGLPLAGTHRPGRMHRFCGNLRQIRSFLKGRCGHRPLQRRPLGTRGRFPLSGGNGP